MILIHAIYKNKQEAKKITKLKNIRINLVFSKRF